MHAALVIAVPPVEGPVPPCRQPAVLPCCTVVIRSGAVLTVPNPALTPVDKNVSVLVVPVVVMQPLVLNPSGTQQLDVLFQTSIRK